MRDRLLTIRSRIGFNELQAMRESSPTGGALGNVTIGELERLESVYGSLNLGQDPEALKANLQRIDNIFADIAYGTPEQIQQQVDQGRISAEDAAPLMFRHELPFDERGRPAGAAQTGQAPRSQPSGETPDEIEELLRLYD